MSGIPEGVTPEQFARGAAQLLTQRCVDLARLGARAAELGGVFGAVKVIESPDKSSRSIACFLCGPIPPDLVRSLETTFGGTAQEFLHGDKSIEIVVNKHGS